MVGALKKHLENKQTKEIFSEAAKLFANSFDLTHNEKTALAYLFKASSFGFLYIHTDTLFEFWLLFTDLIKEEEEKLKSEIFCGINAMRARLTNVCPIVFEENRLYLLRNYKIEKRIKTLLLFSSSLPDIDKELFLEKLRLETTLNSEQREAALSILDNRITFISGGPGTGKSYTAALIAHLFAISAKNNKPRIIVSALTGKAALHLQKEVMKRPFPSNVIVESATLHSLLGISQREGLPNKEVIGDLIIVDEASMIPLFIFADFLERIPHIARVVFLGDPDQLPPIDGGSIYSHTSNVKNHYLTKNLRAEREFFPFIEAIKTKSASTFLALKEKNAKNISFYPIEDLQSTLKEVVKRGEDFFSTLSSSPHDSLKQLSRFIILSPFRGGVLGIENLNALLHSKCASFCPIIVTKNISNLNLFNGSIGGFDKFEKNKLAYFLDGEKIQKLPLPFISSYDYAYALSVHKSQGSEFDEVLLILPPNSEIFGRELLYTALTRAKKKISIFANDETLYKMITSADSDPHIK